MKFKKLVLQSLSVFDNDSYYVVKVKGIPCISVYFKDDFVPGAVIKVLQSINGLHFIGVNIKNKYLLFTY